MSFVGIAVAVAVLALLVLSLAVRIVNQYEQGVHCRLGRVTGIEQPGLSLIIPVVDVLHRVSLRIVTMPIKSRGIITRDNISVDVSAVAYYRIVDAVKSVMAIENVGAAINQIAQTTLRKAVVFPAPLKSTIGELGAFLARETAASAVAHPVTDRVRPNGKPVAQ
jgi:regulator of protease activity HflC (stomatin/prohibitin superfamily)